VYIAVVESKVAVFVYRAIKNAPPTMLVEDTVDVALKVYVPIPPVPVPNAVM
jgi:hypothetical protein